MGPVARAAVAAAGLWLAVAAPAFGEEGWGYQISHELMSPFCPGRTLASCPSEKADELRLWILLQESAGATREEVEAQLVARYGSEILPAPAPDDAADGLQLVSLFLPRSGDGAGAALGGIGPSRP